MTPTSACTELHITFWNGIRYGKALVWGNTDALATLMTASDLSMPSSSTPTSLQAASSTFLPTSFRPCIMWPHHPGHKQMGSGTGISVNNYGPHWIGLRTLQRHPALKSVNPRPLHILPGEVFVEAEARQQSIQVRRKPWSRVQENSEEGSRRWQRSCSLA